LVEAVPGGKGFGPQLLVFFGLLSVLIAAAFIFFQRDLKRLLAYSSVEHIGVIALGLGLGPAGTFAALFHAMNHSTAKAVGFYSAGRLDQALGGHELAALRGAATRAPLWGTALIVSLLALIGAAPFGIFLSEFLVLQAAAASGAWLTVLLLVLGLGVVFAGALRHLIDLGWSDKDAARGVEPVRARGAEIAVALVPLSLLLVVGLWMPAPLRAALGAAAAILGGQG
jgi:hydrogenase-4 component F